MFAQLEVLVWMNKKMKTMSSDNAKTCSGIFVLARNESARRKQKVRTSNSCYVGKHRKCSTSDSRFFFRDCIMHVQAGAFDVRTSCTYFLFQCDQFLLFSVINQTSNSIKPSHTEFLWLLYTHRSHPPYSWLGNSNVFYVQLNWVAYKHSLIVGSFGYVGS